MKTLPKRPESRKEKLINKALYIYAKIEEKNNETKSLTNGQMKALAKRVMACNTKNLTGEISYLMTIFKTL